jgi:hypothetical protein
MHHQKLNKKKKTSVQDVHKHQYHRTLATSTLIISLPEKKYEYNFLKLKKKIL